jgi:hypothetical protein
MWSAYKNQNWLEMLPLIFTQVNTVFMWTCTGCSQVNFYKYFVSGQLQIHGSTFRDYAIGGVLESAFYLDPVNVFLYTWQFLPTLEIENSNTTMSKMYGWYRKISIWVVPAAFVGIFAGIVIAYGKYAQYYFGENTKETSYWFNVDSTLLKTMGYLTTTVNLISCTILFLTIRHAYKLTQKIAEFHENIKN